MTTNQELAIIIRQTPGLTRQKVAELTLAKSVSTVDRWLAPAHVKGKANPTHRRMPEVRLLALKAALNNTTDIRRTTCK